MSKDYVMQLEATIQNLRRDNTLLKEQNAKYKQLEEQLGCPLEVVFKALKQDYIFTKSGKHSRLEFGTYGDFWSICYGLRTQLRVDGYKKTWWLKEDRGE